ncbi:hypothetical protein [uncultured Tolumonas sp.]|uniref:hypothetical protein n=1 Tax=uncultured Tolumonas sp. TaxID=263765 RepID=UPI002A0A6CA2|nr:hypothetical protein [uncultured Tolumonas sp.]
MDDGNAAETGSMESMRRPASFHCLQRPFHLDLIDGIRAGNQQLKLFKQPFGLS